MIDLSESEFVVLAIEKGGLNCSYMVFLTHRTFLFFPPFIAQTCGNSPLLSSKKGQPVSLFRREVPPMKSQKC